MKESVFTTEIVKSLRQSGFWVYKIPDMPHFAGMRTRFDLAKPFDIIALRNNRFYAIETKMLKSYQAFGYRHMRPHQVTSLSAINSFGGNPYVFLNIRQSKPKHINNCIIFKWGEYPQLEQEGCSIKKPELMKLPVIKGKKGLFDLKGFYYGPEACQSFVQYDPDA